MADAMTLQELTAQGISIVQVHNSGMILEAAPNFSEAASRVPTPAEVPVASSIMTYATSNPVLLATNGGFPATVQIVKPSLVDQHALAAMSDDEDDDMIFDPQVSLFICSCCVQIRYLFDAF